MPASPNEGGTLDRGAGSCRCARGQAVLLVEPGPTVQRPMVGAPDRSEALAQGRASALERSLPRGWRVAHAVHGGEPSIAAALESLRASGAERVVVVPMRPQLGAGVNQGALAEVYRCLGEGGAATLHVEVRAWWHDDSGYVDAHARLLHGFVEGHGLNPINSVLVFLAADAANAEEERATVETAELVGRRLGWPRERSTVLACSAARGAGSLQAAIDPLHADGHTGVVVCPITHMAESEDLGAITGNLVSQRSGERGRVYACPPPSSNEEFIKALALLVRRGRQPAREGAPPLMPPAEPRAAVAADVGSLIMAGVSVRPTLEQPAGVDLRHCPHEMLRCFKRPHLETVALLRRLGQSGRVRECWIWNTCSRYECYAWVPPGASAEEKAATLRWSVEEALGPGAADHANVLTGAAAWRHAIRTASGLNSVLVGDAEVADQLQAARCAAQLAGTAGELTGAFMLDVASAVKGVRTETGWGRFGNRYCDVALTRVALRAGGFAGRCVVVGGSTTSCSVLETLAARFGVGHDRVRLIYRGYRKGALVRRLHAAAGAEHIHTVDDYSDPAVAAAIGEADVVFFALDQRQSVVSARSLAATRDLGARPLAIVDFNTFGSVEMDMAPAGLTVINAGEIDEEIGGFDAEVLIDAALPAAVAEAEAWIASHVRDKGPEQRGTRRKEAAAPAAAVEIGV